MSQEQASAVIDLKLEFLNGDGDVIGGENTVTDLLLPNGARVLTYSSIPVGEFIIVKTHDGRFESPAVVKTTELGPDRIPRIVFEFTGNDWQRTWIYTAPPETPEMHFPALLQLSQETSMLLEIIIADLESGAEPDQIFLSELKSPVDDLRSLIYRVQKCY